MTADLALALVAFAFATSITPGPNNLMVLSSGATHGLVRTLPHLLGITLGHSVMVLLLGAGLVSVLEANPLIHQALGLACLVYVAYLARRVATAGAPGQGDSLSRPFSLVEAALFQWVNPKAWAMAITAVTAYAPDGDWTALLMVTALFAVVNLPSVSAWAVMGVTLSHWLQDPRRLRIFNTAMAVLLVGSMAPMLL